MAHDGTASLASKEMPESTLADMARRSRSESSMSTWRRRALEFDGVASAQRGRLQHVVELLGTSQVLVVEKLV